MGVEVHLPPRADQSRLLDFGLVALTKAIAQIAPNRVGGGFLGGPFGYGAHWDNDVFTMRTFYWGDCDCGFDELDHAWSKSNTHADDCYMHRVRDDLVKAGGTVSDFSGTYVDRPQSIDYEAWRKIDDCVRRKWCGHFGLSFPGGSAAHCTCRLEADYQEWRKSHNHNDACSLFLPNFLHKRTGMEVRWYKWIGRDMEVENQPKDLAAVFRECMDSLTASTPADSELQGTAK